jgi:hypothetical protein
MFLLLSISSTEYREFSSMMLKVKMIYICTHSDDEHQYDASSSSTLENAVLQLDAEILGHLPHLLFDLFFHALAEAHYLP